MDGFSSAKAHRFPSIIRDKFSSMFDAVSKRLSTEKSNLLISYALVLTLFADEFQTSLTDIAKDLRMSNATLRTHYETLGCKVSKRNDLSTVTLPVPLQFPTVKRKRRNRWLLGCIFILVIVWQRTEEYGHLTQKLSWTFILCLYVLILLRLCASYLIQVWPFVLAIYIYINLIDFFFG